MSLWGRLFNRGGRSQYYDRGIRLFDQGQYEQAIDEFKRALAQPNSSVLIEKLARFYLSESLAALGQQQLTHSMTGNAIENLLAAIALNPNYADLHFHLGGAYRNQNDLANALLCFERALAINPRYAQARLQYGITLYQIGRREEALAQAEQVVLLDRLFCNAYVEEARQAQARGDHASALLSLEAMGKIEANQALYHARLGRGHFVNGDLEQAQTEYRQAIDIAPGYADLRNQFGIVLHASQRDDEALVQFRQALSINPRYLEARLNYGFTLQRLGRLIEAQEQFDTVLEFDPSNPMALEALKGLKINTK